MAITDIEAARSLDALDAFRSIRDRFSLPEKMIYLDGNSLGALPADTLPRLSAVVAEEWGRGLIGSWNSHDWIGAPQRLGARIAPLIGARANEVIVADSTSVNLFKLIVAALGARPDRTTILSEPGNFPTDLYIAQGIVDMLPGRRLELVPASGVIDAIDEDVAVVVLTHVHYRSGYKHDMAAITAAAHAKGALVIWDLSHSAGAVKIELNAADADLAIGCGYKYLNGGVGAPAFLFVAERLQSELRSPLSGWMGHRAPFAFSDDYAPAPAIDRFLCGTPPIIGMAALERGIATFDGVDLDALFAKGQALCSMFVDLVETRCAEFDFELLTPRSADARGSHVSFAHANAYPICQALIAAGVVPDFRAPDTLRFGFTPLYTSFEDIWSAVDILREIMRTGSWDQQQFHMRARVT
ncbi:kynureninase [Sphingomonas sp. Root710]|uniref:kynureninase n=1 Tax=Sphingomonas sp. Root710 TaxID=1736594 RepID=UPI0006F22848|nr:kynureninase [Sphingomonas sp. Root710]KRB82918.1 kynureninase [Sphingomonas sp. Root710]